MLLYCSFSHKFDVLLVAAICFVCRPAEPAEGCGGLRNDGFCGDGQNAISKVIQSWQFGTIGKLENGKLCTLFLDTGFVKAELASLCSLFITESQDRP
jgi:hypothetical protein